MVDFIDGFLVDLFRQLLYMMRMQLVMLRSSTIRTELMQCNLWETMSLSYLSKNC
jgi:hypothetical protein